MNRKLYVGNLGGAVARMDLENLFGDYGVVVQAKVKTNPASGKNSGFGFVEMGSDDEARAAIAALNGTELDGRAMRVRESRPGEFGGPAELTPPRHA